MGMPMLSSDVCESPSREQIANLLAGAFRKRDIVGTRADAEWNRAECSKLSKLIGQLSSADLLKLVKML